MTKFDPQALKAARKKASITRRELSEVSGIAQSTIYRIEQEGKQPLATTWEALTDAVALIAKEKTRYVQAVKKVAS